MRTIAAFDFDGTLVKGDTFIRFAIFARGLKRFLSALLRSSPRLVLWKMGLGSNSQAKETLFGHLFRGMTVEEFNELGRRFTSVPEPRQELLSGLQQHLKQGHTVYIVSASIRNWVEPWARANGVTRVLATEAEVDERGRLTGHFSTPNCYGTEKVARLSAAEPRRNEYTLYAYGDSAGDDALLAYADFQAKSR